MFRLRLKNNSSRIMPQIINEANPTPPLPGDGVFSLLQHEKQQQQEQEQRQKRPIYFLPFGGPLRAR